VLERVVVRAPQGLERGGRGHQHPARTQHPPGLAGGARVVVEVLEHVEREDHVERRVREGQGGRVAGGEREPAPVAGPTEGVPRAVEADPQVRVDLRQREPGPAPQVEDPARPVSRRAPQHLPDDLAGAAEPEVALLLGRHPVVLAGIQGPTQAIRAGVARTEFFG
jgi:hypothetical protein